MFMSIWMVNITVIVLISPIFILSLAWFRQLDTLAPWNAPVEERGQPEIEDFFYLMLWSLVAQYFKIYICVFGFNLSDVLIR